MTGATCSRVAPGISLVPASRTAAPGATVSYSATIVNNNPAACGSSTFSLTQGLPAGWTGGFSAPSLSLAAGASGSSTWSVASTSAATDGSYNIDLTASENAVSNSSMVHATLVVYRDNTAPTLSVTSPVANAVLSGAKATLAATASDASGLSAVEFYDGTNLIGRDTSAPYSVSWTLRKVSKGAHTIIVKAIDTAGNSQSVSVNVTVN
jgi:Bacterial Ig domain/NPCBM-associated, NEW3 domain of alpha-galactosidase